MTGGFGRDPIPGMGEPVPSGLTPETARLRVLNGPATGQTFALDQPRLLVGRNDPPVLTVDLDMTACELGQTPMVSRRHAEIQWVDGQLQVVDLGSTNGTCVNGERLLAQGSAPPSAPAPLQTGDRVKFANLELEVILIGG